MQDQIDYPGHTVSSEGLRPIVEKIAALKEAPTPTNLTELRSYLGLLKYYAKFLPDLSSLLAPLHALTHSGFEWSWTSECEQMFKRSKTLICGADILCHYDSSKLMRLACDASSYGLGAVISHISPDCTEKPIAFASCTMTSAEKNYSQVEREALVIIFGVKRFRQYLWGRHFTRSSTACDNTGSREWNTDYDSSASSEVGPHFVGIHIRDRVLTGVRIVSR